MAFLGPIRVSYSGPPEDEARLVSMARGRLGYLEAMRLGYPESPMSNHISLPGGGSISVQMAGGYATARITAPRPAPRKDAPPDEKKQEPRTIRRFVDYPRFMLCASPTSRPLQITLEQNAAGAVKRMVGVLAYKGDEEVTGVIGGLPNARFAPYWESTALSRPMIAVSAASSLAPGDTISTKAGLFAATPLPPTTIWVRGRDGRILATAAPEYLELSDQVAGSSTMSVTRRLDEKGTGPSISHNWAPDAYVVGVGQVQFNPGMLRVVTSSRAETWDARETTLPDGFNLGMYAVPSGLMSTLLYRSDIMRNPNDVRDFPQQYKPGKMDPNGNSWIVEDKDSTAGSITLPDAVTDPSTGAVSNVYDYNVAGYGVGGIVKDGFWFAGGLYIAEGDLTGSLATSYFASKQEAALFKAQFIAGHQFLLPLFDTAAHVQKDLYGAWSYASHGQFFLSSRGQARPAQIPASNPEGLAMYLTYAMADGWVFSNAPAFIFRTYDQISDYNHWTGELHQSYRLIRGITPSGIHITAVNGSYVAYASYTNPGKQGFFGDGVSFLEGNANNEMKRLSLGAAFSIAPNIVLPSGFSIRAMIAYPETIVSQVATPNGWMVYSANEAGAKLVTLNEPDGTELLTSEDFPKLKALLDAAPSGYTGPTGYCSFIRVVLPPVMIETEEPI